MGSGAVNTAIPVGGVVASGVLTSAIVPNFTNQILSQGQSAIGPSIPISQVASVGVVNQVLHTDGNVYNVHVDGSISMVSTPSP